MSLTRSIVLVGLLAASASTAFAAGNTPSTQIAQLESRGDGNTSVKVVDAGTAFSDELCTVADRAVVRDNRTERAMLDNARLAGSAGICVQLRVDGCADFNANNPGVTAPLVTKVQMLFGAAGEC